MSWWQGVPPAASLGAGTLLAVSLLLFCGAVVAAALLVAHGGAVGWLLAVVVVAASVPGFVFSASVVEALPQKAATASTAGLSEVLNTRYGATVTNTDWVAQAVRNRRPEQVVGALLRTPDGQVQQCTLVTPQDVDAVKAYCGGVELARLHA